MAYTPKQMYAAQPGTTDTLLYTAPAVTPGAIIKHISVTNTTGSAATITLAFPAAGALTAAKHYLSALSVAANATVDFPLNHILAASETIRALQGTASALTVHISGIEIS